MYRDQLEIWLERITERLEVIEKKIDRMQKHNSCLEGDKLMDTQDVATLLKVTPRTIQRWVKKGTLKSLKIEGCCMFLESEVHRFIRYDYNS
ncbi:helix-turn-helix domain-containing protein [Petrimonas sp.]|uniref:helix-turn-helix domain-containing protein n=1 Tax=Petrimonas sp. TaxID=2023866 RepID=UPI003F51864B